MIDSEREKIGDEVPQFVDRQIEILSLKEPDFQLYRKEKYFRLIAR